MHRSRFPKQIPMIEPMESRLLLSGNSDLVHSVATLSEPRSELTAVAVGGKAMFAGGIKVPLVPTDVADIYDAKTSLWSTAHLSVARSGLAAVTLGGKAFFAEGADLDPNGPSDVVDIYDSATGLWSTAHLSQPRNFPAAVAVGDMVLVAGSDGSNDSNNADVYDAATGRWSTALLPNALGAPIATVVGGKAMFVDPEGAADVYDSVTGRWAAFSLPKSVGDDFAGAVTAGTKALFSTESGRVFIYDDITEGWSTSQLPGSASGTGVTTSLGGKALFATVSSVAIFDAATEQWSTAPLSLARANMAAVTIGDKAMVSGGEIAYASPVDTVDIYSDAAPAPGLDGIITAGDATTVSVTIRNSGDTALPGPFTVAVYGSRVGRKSILLGGAIVKRALRSGTSRELSVSLSIPRGTLLGDYRLVAQADGGGQPSIFAARDDLTPPTTGGIRAPMLKTSQQGYTFTVTYHDNDRIDTDTLDGNDLVVTGPDSFAKNAQLVSVSRGRRGSTQIGTYIVRGDGLRWDSSDNGAYAVHLQDGEVCDSASNAALGRRIGVFTVAIDSSVASVSAGAPTGRLVLGSKRKVNDLFE